MIRSAAEILLNGKPLKEYSLASLRRSVSMVSQDAFLFDMTIAENIAYGRDLSSELDMDRVRSAAVAAYADGFIRELPEGYETPIGERGVRLSGGQKQRLTIARALLKDAPLLILDEATSALDSESEHMVQKALDNLMLNRTSLIIAHPAFHHSGSGSHRGHGMRAHRRHRAARGIAWALRTVYPPVQHAVPRARKYLWL